MGDHTWQPRGPLWVGVVLGGLLLTSCALPGTQPRVAAIHSHVAVVPTVAPPPTIVISPANGTQNVGLDAPVVVTASSGHLDAVSITEAGPSTALQGVLSPDGRIWRMSQALDQRAEYTVVATASSTAGSTSTATSAFATLTAAGRLLTGMTPPNGSTVGVGEPIDLKFNTAIPMAQRTALLERIQITSIPPVMGAWHWFSSTVVHFRPEAYWLTGTKVILTANLRGFDVGNGTWGLGSWSASFQIGAKHMSVINNTTHAMHVFDNGKLYATYPVSLGKPGYSTIQGTLIVLYKTPVIVMKSCPTFGTPAACIPGGAQYYNDPVYDDTAVSTSGYFIHAAPWSVYAQGHENVSHGCVNLSTAHAIQFYNFSIPGDVVQVENTGYNASYADGEGDWQLPFAQFSNTVGLGAVWTGPVGSTSLRGETS